jgi:prolipoprotein diacylglyceryl transferase
MTGFITWDVSKIIFTLGSFQLRWYGLLFGLGFVAAYLVLKRIFTKEGTKIELLDALTMYIALATIIGARLGHILFYEPSYYFNNPIEILKVWRGGLASHGAAIAIITAMVIFARKFKLNLWWLADRLAIAIPLVAMFVRLGNLMNSEIFGRPTNVPWAFIYKNINNIPRHPSQLYEAISYFIIFITCLFVFKNKSKFGNGFVAGFMLASLFTARFIIEFFKDIQVDFEKKLTIDMGQILSIPLIMLGIAFMIISIKQKKKS